MAIEIPPVKSTQAILIRAGSEFLRLECRHDESRSTKKKIEADLSWSVGPRSPR